MKYTGNNLLALAIVIMMFIMSTATAAALSLAPSNAFAASDNQEESDTQVEESNDESNDDNNQGDTQVEESDNQGNDDDNDDNNGDNDDNDKQNADTESDTDSKTEAITLQSKSENQGSDNGFGDTQPDRVGSHDDQTSGEGADAGGTVTDETIPCENRDDQEGCVGEAEDDTVDTNCFGKVTQHEAQEHKDPDSDEGTLGEHSSDPVPGDDDRETPRQGIGNQDQGHPAAHGAFNAQFEEEDAENVEENC